VANGQINGKQRRRAKIINVNCAINVPRCLSFQLTVITLDFHMVRILNMDDAKQNLMLQYSQLFLRTTN
jgi:Fe2+ transport system protein B